MASPFPVRNRPRGDQIERFQFADQSAVGSLQTTPINHILQLPPNAHRVYLNLHSTGNDVALRLSVRPFTNPEQTTVASPAYNLVPPSGTAATFLSNAATNTSRGLAALVSPTSFTPYSVSSIYGLQVRVSSVSTVSAGTYTLDVLAVPEV